MHPLGITPSSREKNRLQLIKRLKPMAGIFAICCLLPFLVLIIFALIPNNINKGIEAATAKLITNSGTGTGFLIGSRQMMTARHVVDQLAVGDSLTVEFENVEPPFQVKAAVQWMAPTNYTRTLGSSVPLDYFLSDAATLVFAKPIEDIAPLFLGISEEIENLDEVILVGYPNGDYSITQGNISSTSHNDLDLFKIDAVSNPGNSGGPCVRASDQTVIGILVGGPSDPATDGENVVIKIDNVLNLMDASGIPVMEDE